jgi:transcription initiation factor TFIID TATA-box-binding protein
METVSTMGSGSLGREVDLETLVDKIENALVRSVEANFTSDSIVTLRLNEDGPAYTVYRTGTFQVRGATSEGELATAEEAFVNVLDEISMDVPKYEFEHITSVFMDNLERDMNLSALAISLGLEYTEYEPEQFPGVVYRPQGFSCVLLVFGSGKVIVTGGRSRSEAKDALDFLEKHVDEIASL